MNRRDRVGTTFAHGNPTACRCSSSRSPTPSSRASWGAGSWASAPGRRRPRASGRPSAAAGARALIRENVNGMLEAYEKVGFDMFWFRPTDYLACVMLGLPDDITANSIFDVAIEETEPNTFRIASTEHGFWSVEKYEPESDTCVTVRRLGGRGRLASCAATSSTSSAAPMCPCTRASRDGLESIRIAVERAEGTRGDEAMFVLGAADIAMPTFLPFLPLFLETMVDEPSLVERYMAATTEGVLTILRAELDLGVDGILGAEDWCFGKGPLVLPAMFRRFMAPHLKRIVDECHRRGVPFIKHLDGNTTVLLDILVDEVGIDGLHSIEPPAGHGHRMGQEEATATVSRCWATSTAPTCSPSARPPMWTRP